MSPDRDLFHEMRALLDEARARNDETVDPGELAARLTRAERRLRVLEHEYVDALQASPVALVEIDRDGIIRQWNTAAERLLGHESAGVIGRSMADILIPERKGYRERHRAAFAAVAAGGPHRGLVYNEVLAPMLHADGHEITVRLFILPLRRGALLSHLATIRDPQPVAPPHIDEVLGG